MGLFKKNLQKQHRNIFSALDIGSSKVCCVIGALRNDSPSSDQEFQMLGLGQQVARGVKNSAISDLDTLEDSVLMAVQTAEQMARQTIRDVYVNLPAASVTSTVIETEVALNGVPVEGYHIKKLMNISHHGQICETEQVIHVVPMRYILDDNKHVRDPKGMAGQRLKAMLLILTVPKTLITNLTNCIGRCHLDVSGFVVGPYAAALSTLVEDELELGVTLIDIGGGSTSTATFFEGNLIHVDNVPLGGIHITNDIARILTTPISQAERIKTLYGNLVETAGDEKETIVVPQLGEEKLTNVVQVPRHVLGQIIRARADEIFEMIVDRLSAAGLSQFLSQQVVLTGGTSLLPGIREFASGILGKHVRLGHPQIFGQNKEATSALLSTCSGLLRYSARYNELSYPSSETREKPFFWNRFTMWIKENI